MPVSVPALLQPPVVTLVSNVTVSPAWIIALSSVESGFPAVPEPSVAWFHWLESVQFIAFPDVGLEYQTTVAIRPPHLLRQFQNI